MKVYIVIASSCCNMDKPTLNAYPFPSKKKARGFIASEWKYAITENYRDEYKDYKKTSKRERELCCYYEFNKGKNGFEIFRNGYYDTDHFTLEMVEKDLEVK